MREVISERSFDRLPAVINLQRRVKSLEKQGWVKEGAMSVSVVKNRVTEYVASQTMAKED